MFELALVALATGVGVGLLLGLATPRARVAREGRTHTQVTALMGRLRHAREAKAPGEADVPSMLDIVTLGLSAGLSFDASLELYCERYEGRLAKALEAAILAWRLGAQTRSEGLRQAAKTADAPSLSEVACVVEEALELGLPLADTLTRQADAIRAARRAIVEERIERVPVKMLIPLGTLIVPAMLLAILGPLLSSVIELG